MFLYRSTRISKVCLASPPNFGHLYDFYFIFFYRNRFKSSDLCLGFCDAALDQFSSNPSSNTGLSSTEEKSPMSFVTEPPLGPRPDLIEDDQDDQNGFEEEYDESRCQVEPEDFNEY